MSNEASLKAFEAWSGTGAEKDNSPSNRRDWKVWQASRKALEAEQAQTVEPVAWGMKKDGLMVDIICPDEHEALEGAYTIPLYTHPAPPPAEPPTKQPLSTERAALINTPEKVREFFSSNFDSLHYGREDQEPDEDDKYTMSAHDIIAAFDWSADMLEAEQAQSAGHELSDGEIYSRMSKAVNARLNQREPLSDDQIDAVTRDQWGGMKDYTLSAHRAFARAIEQAHRITPQGDKQ